MNAPNLHLNLLRESEKLSSSPVRVRVMLPVLALLLCVGVALWWAMLFTQMMLVKGQISSLKNELGSKNKAHASILSEMARARDLKSELDQLEYYRAGRREYGALLANIAKVMPGRVQLTSLVVPEPSPQLLLNPKNPKLPPLLGPTNDTEAVTLRLTGRVPEAKPVTELMESFEGDTFKPWLVIDKDGGKPSPRVRPLRQEAGSKEGGRLMVFDIEYRCPDRRFGK